MTRALVAVLLAAACSAPDRRPEAHDPVDFAFAPMPGDFKGAAPCAAAGACAGCCCNLHQCRPRDLHPCERELDAAVCPGCELLDMLELSDEDARLCDLCLAGDVDAGVACTISPQ